MGTLLYPEWFGNNNETMPLLQNVLQRLEKKRKNPSYPTISIDEYILRTTNGKEPEELTVCFGHVIRLRGFIDNHPGGTFINRFIGKDMTPWMLATHSKSESALKHLTSRAIGVLEGETDPKYPFNLSLLPQIDKDYVKLFFTFIEDGSFTTQHAWTIRDFIETYIPIIIGYYLVITEPSLYWLGITLMVLTGGRQGIFYHDIMHRSVFSSASFSRKIVYITSIIVWGFDFNAIGDIHDVHHGFVNLIGLDTAIDMPMLPVDPKQLEIGKLGFSSVLRRKLWAANAFFYGFLAWMVLPFYTLEPFISHYLRSWKMFLTKGVVAIFRIFLVFYFWEYQSPIVIAAVIGFFYFALIGSLNHFHKQMTTADRFFEIYGKKGKDSGEIDTFVALQSQTVQNTEHGLIVNALLGHFTLHIEHHLFPMMPRRGYIAASPKVQQLLKKYNLSYSVCSQSEAIKAFNNTLRNPEMKKLGS